MWSYDDIVTEMKLAIDPIYDAITTQSRFQKSSKKKHVAKDGKYSFMFIDLNGET